MFVQASLVEPVTCAQEIAGIDEVGRGCLAGPVVAAACVLPHPIPGLCDSKALSAKKREELAVRIRREARWAIGLVGQRTIDRINILQATFMAMAMAAARLTPPPRHLCIDGCFPIPLGHLRRFWEKHNDAPLPGQTAIVHGDAQVAAISAASILAKTYRDALMQRFAERWPAYGFAHHVGYGTALHRAMLARLGPCPLHRRSFRGVVVQGDSHV